MTGIILAIVFTFWYILSLYLSENYGKNFKPGVEGIFFISMMMSPIIAMVVILYQWKKSAKM